jgi:hypothetical protein
MGNWINRLSKNRHAMTPPHLKKPRGGKQRSQRPTQRPKGDAADANPRAKRKRPRN